MLQSYDLFLHNCNNFTNDFAMFLVGKGIPDHITSLPQTVLNTPFGQMLKPQLDSAMRQMTQVPVAPSAIPSISAQSRTVPNGVNGTSPASLSRNGTKQPTIPIRKVHNVTELHDLDALLTSAKKSCAVIFFTSATCAPCRICYPAFEQLAQEASEKAVLVKVDLSMAFDIGAKYQVRATPTFMTFLNGDKLEEWSGADPAKLLGNVRLLIQMAYPPHPHTNLRLPTLQQPHRKPVTFRKMPPLDKLIAKLGPAGNSISVIALKDFVAARNSSGASSAPLPSLPDISGYILRSVNDLPPSTLFPLIDLFRLAVIDPRVSGYFAEEQQQRSLLLAILVQVNSLGVDCPYTLRIVTLQMACNLFTSPLYPPQLLSSPVLAGPLIQLVASSLLDTAHAPVRVSAASLAFNIAAFNHLQRLEQKADLLSESAQVELVACLLESIDREEESEDGVKGLGLALGLLAYGSNREGEVRDVLRAMGARKVIAKAELLSGEKALVDEIIEVVD